MSNSRALFERIRDGGESEIRRLISEEEPESVILDFKEKSTPDGAAKMGDDDKRNLSKALSGFANAQGGLLVWGVKDHSNPKLGRRVARSAEPISRLNDFVTQLHGHLPNAVIRSVDGVEIVPIPNAEASDKGFVIIYVPESQYAPHRAELSEGKRYYRRTGDSFLPMEHYELEDMFGRRQRPTLEPALRFLPTGEEGHWLTLEVSNQGRTFAQFIGADLEFPFHAIHPDTRSDFEKRLCLTRDQRDRIATLSYRSAAGEPPLFPGDTTHIWPNRGGRIRVCIGAHLINEFDHHPLALRLFADSAPSEKREFTLFQLRSMELSERPLVPPKTRA